MKVRDLRSMRPNLTLCDSSIPSTSVITTSPTSFFEIITAFKASLSNNWSPSSLRHHLSVGLRNMGLLLWRGRSQRLVGLHEPLIEIGIRAKPIATLVKRVPHSISRHSRRKLEVRTQHRQRS
jgi:hypothetical protein